MQLRYTPAGQFFCTKARITIGIESTELSKFISAPCAEDGKDSPGEAA